MVVPLLAEGFSHGITNIPFIWTIARVAIVCGTIYLLKKYFGGARCTSERVMHGKVVLLTGGTSGIGATIARQLATRGAQIILLTQHEPNDAFLVDYIEDLRSQTNNELIYAEQVDLASLHSIRLFATKWVDNAPPRRLDMVVLCANVQTPYWGTSRTTSEGLEEEWMVDYLSTFHLLSILSPAIRAQPPDRDVRILFSTCSSYINGALSLDDTETATKSGQGSYARAKLALMTFAQPFQQHLDSYTRPDKQPNNARCFIIDPGYSRTPGMRRWLTGGSLFGLLTYLLTWPIWWLILKSPEQGAQSYLFTAMDPEFGHGAGGRYIKECKIMRPLRADVENEEAAKKLWEFSEKQIERQEKQGAVKRALAKKEAEQAEKQTEPSSKSETQSESKKSPAAGSRRSKKTK